MANMMDTNVSPATGVTNFGRNVTFKVDNYVRPGGETEILKLLETSRKSTLRAAGAYHSWNEAVATRKTLLDLSKLKALECQTGDDNCTVVSVEAGCSVNEVLEKLVARKMSLPTFGIIGKQSIAGAISTATHGSGHSSMSNAVVAARIAAYDGSGQPRIYELTENDEALAAARCAVGCMGVLLGVTLTCTDRQLVSEKTKKADSIDGVLGEEAAYPLQQFYLVPFAWKWYAHLRKTSDGEKSSAITLAWYYIARFWKIEFLFNLIVKLLANIPGFHRIFPAFYRKTYNRMNETGKEVIDYADKILMMRDDLFRHLEMELFVRPDRLHEAAEFIEGVLRFCAGETPGNFGAISQTVSTHGDTKILAGLKGTYAHHYPITFRHVLKDDAMISMTSDGDAYAISFITYSRKSDSFEAVMHFLASVMAKAFGARPHWGKLIPLDAGELERLYPRLPEFRAQCESVDPNGVFRNRFVNRKMWNS